VPAMFLFFAKRTPSGGDEHAPQAVHA
jgi:hypothetical protein